MRWIFSRCPGAGGRVDLQGGFVLVEVLVAIAILGVLIVALSGLFASGYAGARLAGSRSEAVGLAHEKMERLAALDYSRGLDGRFEEDLQQSFGLEGSLEGWARPGCCGEDGFGCLEGEEGEMRWEVCIAEETLEIGADDGTLYGVGGCRLEVRVFPPGGEHPAALFSFVRGGR